MLENAAEELQIGVERHVEIVHCHAEMMDSAGAHAP